ncbi:MAG: hypothetical protein GXO88_08820 [Chlorobi bacterium]|nr:hypothetical protein [Chlorobiota bacterium]
MKRIKFLIIMVFSGLINISSSQDFGYFELESLNRIESNNGFSPQVNIYSNYMRENSSIGFYFFALANKNWGEAYGGITLQAAKWLKINLGLGLETNPGPYRFNITFFAYHKRMSLLQIYEYGGSGFWYRIRANYNINTHHNIGLLAERYYGIGPVYEYKLKFPLGFLGAPLMDPEDGTFKMLTSLRYYF